MTFPYHLWDSQTDATEDIRPLTIEQQVCSHGYRSEVERWSASRMISFLDRANITLDTITNLTMLYIHTDVHHVSMNKEHILANKNKLCFQATY